ncbi:MAG TPA: pilus assembly protein PilM [Pirellulaceae bacterium]|nr:pilus assembly protein PilM [Pirellulaceae bacterium]
MVRWLTTNRYSPIGIDVGTRSVKLVQFTADQKELVEISRAELAAGDLRALTSEVYAERVADAISRAREGRNFRGKNIVLGLSDRDLYLQNIRVPRCDGPELERVIMQEAAGRIPYNVGETEIRYFEMADVRQGDATLREVVIMACHRPNLERVLGICPLTNLQPIAVDVETAALVRSYASQYRRDEDRQQRALCLHIGYNSTAVVITKGDEPLFVKYLDVGGRHFDESVAKHLSMELVDAAALRRNNGDRRADAQDPEIASSIAEGMRPVIERLSNELAMCIRYHSVTFRGQPLVRLVIGGGEAATSLLESLGKRLSLKCELSDPLRYYTLTSNVGRRGQWDVAVGLALRSIA